MPPLALLNRVRFEDMDPQDAASQFERIERRVDQQGKWTDEKFEGLRRSIDEIRTTTNRTAVIMEGIEKNLPHVMISIDDLKLRQQEVEGTLNGRHGEPGLVQQVKDLAAKDIQNQGSARAKVSLGSIMQWGLGTLLTCATLAVLAWTAFKMH